MPESKKPQEHANLRSHHEDKLNDSKNGPWIKDEGRLRRRNGVLLWSRTIRSFWWVIRNGSANGDRGYRIRVNALGKGTAQYIRVGVQYPLALERDVHLWP